MIVPSCIIFINTDLGDQVQTYLIRQLHITTVMSGSTFDATVAADPTYPDKVKQLDQRVLVIRPFTELNNRDLADLVLFVKNAMVCAEVNKFGPPGQTVAITNIHYGQFGIF